MADDLVRARAIYDATAEQYARVIGTEISDAFEAALDVSFLDALVAALPDDPAPVLDLGTGVGRIAAWLTARRVTTIGLDLAPGMLHVARAAHPHLALGAATLARLPLRDHCARGATAWYSIIHTPGGELTATFAEIARVLLPGAPLLLGFQSGADERVDRPNAHGTSITLTSHRHDADTVARLLAESGFDVLDAATRPPELPHETAPQSFVLTRAPG